MKGSIRYRKDRNVWEVNWYDEKAHKNRKITSHYLYGRLDTETLAKKCLAEMQADKEAELRGEGIFSIEKYTQGQTDTLEYLFEWLDVVEPNLKPNTHHCYKVNILNHLEPFFRQHPTPLRKLNLTLFTKLMNTIDRGGHGTLNVMSTLHNCLDFAWRSEKITHVPPFPRRGEYGIVKKPVQWLPEERQLRVIHAIPEIHQPIFAWCKYHYRRPSEAIALQKADFDGSIFTVRWNISNRILVPATKTGIEFDTPCVDDFRPYMELMPKTFSKFFFTNPNAYNKDKRYDIVILEQLWRRACKETGESIKMYPGLKHSSCCQYLHEKGGSISELSEITGQSVASLSYYLTTEVVRKKELMEKKVVRLEEKTNR